MTVAQLVARSLIANGIDQLYCLPGVQNDDFFNALYDIQDQVTPIHARHEQGAVYMALGAALATGQPQAFSIVPGPGFLNGTAALSTAFAVNAPLMSLIGQIPSGAIEKGFGLLHEISGQSDTLASLTKSSDMITQGATAAEQLRSAWGQLQSGRPRPVGLEVPVNVWRQEASGDVTAEPIPAPQADPSGIDKAAELIAAARSPMIAVGSGAQGASALVTDLAERLNAPVMAFRTGHGVVSSDHELRIDMPTGHRLWPGCDLVIGLGTRLQAQRQGWGMDSDLKVIHIDIDPVELQRISSPDAAICADLQQALPLLLDALGAQPDRSDWSAHVARVKAEMHAELTTTLAPQWGWLQAIRDVLPRDGIFVDELTQVGYVSRILFPSYAPRTFLSSGYQGTLGWGMATAAGAAHARRDVPVVSVAGDGGALFTISELATAVRHKIPVNYIVFNDNAFGNVRRFQIENYDNRPIASDLTSPDFVALAQSFGVTAEKAATPDALRSALGRAIDNDGPNLIEVPMSDDLPSPWPYIMMPKLRG
ncbi:MAG: thiamine pyrophosphate-dependent enzyme [Pseudomonadota bacterium]